MTTLPYDEKTKTLVDQRRLFMKKLQLVELGIITVVLIVGYKMITSLMSLVTTLLFGLTSGVNENIGFLILPMVLFFAFYTITFFTLALNINPLARFLCRQPDDSFGFTLNKTAILHVIIIAICIGSFLNTIPDVLEHLINKYLIYDDEEYSNNEMYRWNRGQETFLNSLTGLIIGIILLVFSKRIAVLFGKETHSIEINSEKIEGNI